MAAPDETSTSSSYQKDTFVETTYVIPDEIQPDDPAAGYETNLSLTKVCCSVIPGAQNVRGIDVHLNFLKYK